MYLSRDTRGFTLIEIMMALALLAFILGAVYSSFGAISKTDRAAVGIIEKSFAERSLVECFRADISSIFIDTLSGAEEENGPGIIYGIVGERLENDLSRLDFTATVDDGSGKGRPIMAELGYRLEISDEDKGSLFRRVDETPDDDIREGGESFELLDNVRSLTFDFLNEKGVWLSSWDSTGGDGIPVAVRANIVFYNGEDNKMSLSPIFPIMQGREL